MKNITIASAILMASASFAWSNVTVDFEDLTLSTNSFQQTAPFVSRQTGFNNIYTAAFGSWQGFAYSNVNNFNVGQFTNQYASRADPVGQGIYGVAYAGFSTAPIINLPAGETPISVLVTNTAYAAFDMRDGSPFSKKFGGVSENDPDFFDVIFTGFSGQNAAGISTGSATFRLADFTFVNNTQDYIVSSWSSLSLLSLGQARSIQIGFASSDVGAFGINTPTYVAIDNLQLIPEPMMLAALAMALPLVRRRR